MDLASILTIVGYFVPEIFKRCVDWIQKHWGGIDPELLGALKKLEINMLNAQTMIRSIRADTNDGLLELLKKLKEVAYDADDLVDELEYLRLKKQVEEGDNVDNHSSPSTHIKASSFYIFGDDNKSIDMINNIAERLELITSAVRSNAKLLKIDKLTQNLMESSSSDHRVTTSLLRSAENVLGREKEMDEIIELLSTPPAPATSSSKNMIFVLPIVGIGGIGKTTLAQLVYNNERVKREFDVMMWVHVSSQFDVVRLTREMLEGLGVPKSDVPISLNSMQELLKAKLRSKRFLLVLDDVWNSERSNWEKLCAPLGSGQPGCKILITTRLVINVSNMDNDIHTMSPITLKGFSDDVYWSLFVKCAFGGENADNHPKLAEIGRQIVKKLGGSPLAAKTLGGLLRVKLDIDHWWSILESDIWKLQQNIDDIMPTLRLSYQYLPPHLQQCFAYCSVFPKGYKFDVETLVVMWIAQGYVQDKTKSGKKRLMDIGREYFHELERMYFFDSLNWREYLVHDLLHDLAEFVFADECFRVDGSKQVKEIPRTVRHLYARLDLIKMDVLKSLCNLRNLRTIIIDGYTRYYIDILEDLFNELRRVRVLDLKSLNPVDDIPNKIGHMIHLRCMVVQEKSKLPNSCSQLYQLQFLKNYNSMSSSPLAIGKLTCLQELDSFSVGKEKEHGIGQLKNLRELGGTLTLQNLENVTGKTEASEAQLNQKEHLLKLELIWNGSTSPMVAEEVLEGLQPPPFIKELIIHNYRGFKSPTWVTGLTFLTKLLIVNCLVGDSDLTKFLQDLMRISTLRIEECPKITTLPFPDVSDRSKALTELSIINCPELMTLRGLQALVSIETLAVVGCPKLTTCPLDHTKAFTLRVCKLTIDNPALLRVLLKTQSLHYLQYLKIQFYGLTYLNIKEEEEIYEGIYSHLTSLKKLKFRFCGNLEFLPAYLKSLPCLEELNVLNCYKLRSLPLMPASLKTLRVRSCSSLPKSSYEKTMGEDCYKIIWED